MLKKKINPNFNPLFVPSFCVPPLLSTPAPADIFLNSEEVYSRPLLWQSCEILTSTIQDKIVQLGRMVQTHPTAYHYHLSSLNIPCLRVQVGEIRLYQDNMCKLKQWVRG